MSQDIQIAQDINENDCPICYISINKKANITLCDNGHKLCMSCFNNM